MKKYVIDTGVLFLHLIDDERVRPYFKEINEGRAKAFICDVNLAEYYYKTCEKLGREIADVRYNQIRVLINPVSTNQDLTREAGKIKCKYRDKLSLADCFVLALSKIKGAILLTTDSDLAEIKEVKVKHFPV